MATTFISGPLNVVQVAKLPVSTAPADAIINRDGDYIVNRDGDYITNPSSPRT
jgi:hypothetical protein